MSRPLVDEPTFWKVLGMLKGPLEESQRQGQTPEVAWATRQAFLTVITFMEYWAVQDGVAPAAIAKFDAEARESARGLIDKMLWYDRPKPGVRTMPGG